MTHRGNCYLKTCHNEETTKLYNIKLREYVMRYWFSEEDGKRYTCMIDNVLIKKVALV